ncbi:MAG: hypothetical protein V4754_06800 [Pseudomonadota bacterium]
MDVNILSIKIYKFTFFICMLLLFFSVIAFFVPKENKSIFYLSIFFIPILWSFWLVCSTLIFGNYVFWKLFILLIAININIIFISISLSIVDNWSGSRDKDFIIVIFYFPVIMPFVILSYFFPNKFNDQIFSNLDSLEKFLGNSVCTELTLVLTFMSMLAIMEATVLRAFANIIRNQRKRNVM